MKSVPILVSGLSLLVSVLAQGPTDSPVPASCTFSCPAVDSVSRPLVKRPHAVGFNSHYSIFECAYHTRGEPRDFERKCSYYKETGLKALSATDDDCPPNAVPCPEAHSTSAAGLGRPPTRNPMFSNFEKDEVPSWVVGGRYLLYLKEHNRRSD
ncbi:hypothetical protein M413DRAFT_31825 [Hebeloma cylindrosporum]|uniref:Uncharacterized protein n=1 Tax=Hebeloma cylindrosporum TaxID=76867 RepID=A0A0C3BXR2_HEBCY|nr:hypothetical protein M413DRAFT_31825 [Hebeloma cylindrosporum h7]